ncbi:17405_t:CDS:2 [Dentiscutata erythropus]|uniref:17405_t:CDS:1 n=1 Tax=Dentiscutata erythropus TaxID=1348616 RepID=A0A9N9BE81_9GLOM|nr:17405_t:CDS:2 [Dentiscutata erythropus]
MASACFTGKYRGITGIITFIEEGYETRVKVKITGGLTDTSGMYPYHVHEFPINYTGSCESTGEHLDPIGVGKVKGYKCNPEIPEECEAGDLSGKYGALRGTPSGMVEDEYTDPFITLRGEYGVIGRSVVIHAPHTPPGVPAARIACADIVCGKCNEYYY